jgi:TPR repeat protein
LQAARKNDWRSVNNIGVLIYLGQAGFQREEQWALQFFEQAARHGIREAEMNMTVLLTLGSAKGVQDRPRSFEILSRICRREFCSRQALNNLGCMYLRGFGCTADPERALQYFQTAMQMGSQVAKYNIGIMYLNGLGVEKDNKKGNELIDSSRQEKQHEDYPCIESATDLTKLLMFTTMNSCL